MRTDRFCHLLAVLHSLDEEHQPKCLLVPAWGEAVPGSLPAQWNVGAKHCSKSLQPPLQVQRYEPQTYILRESLCVNPEGNFVYLLIGSQKALVIDTGAVADPGRMPLARTVLSLLPIEAGLRPPAVRAFFRFNHWPAGSASTAQSH